MEDKSREYGQQNLTLPHDVVPLPSQGMFYKNKRKTIKVGYLTASDENILMGGGADLTMNLLRAKIYEPDVKIEDLMEGDVEAILVFLRNTGFGPEMNVTAIDPKTNKSFTTQVMLDELNIIKGQEPNEDGTFITTLPRSNSSVKLKPLTYGEIMELRRFEENYPKGRVVPSITWRLGKEIIELDGETDKGKIARLCQLPTQSISEIF
jgi:hypothetical protein